MALIDVTVKTLNGQNHIFSVPELTTVNSFKDKISGSIEIPADTQRLIYRGRVMQDEKQLKDYDLHGKAVHVVQRAPPTSQPSAGSTGVADNPQPNVTRPQLNDLLDVQVHVGTMNSEPTTREARNRITQAELNMSIINTALNLLEERTGISSSGRSDEESQERMDTSQPDAGQQAGSESQGQPGNGGTTAGGQQQQQDNAAGMMATELADVLDRVLSTNDRITPQLRRYRNYLRSEESYPAASQEARNAQEVVNRVTEAMHAMSHVMHNLSDLMVDMNAPVPRTILATPMSPFMTGGTTMSIPIHMNVRPRTNGNRQRQQESTQAPGGTATSSTPASTTAAGGAPQSSTFTTAGGTGPLPFDIPGLQPGTAGVSVISDIHAAVVTSDEIMGGIDIPLPGGNATTSITVVSSSGGDESTGPEQPTPANTTTSASAGPAVPTASSAAVISTSETRPSQAQPTVSSSSSSTSSFSYGPTTNVNIIGMPNVNVGSLPNIPGLPGGMLQNIVQNILSSHVGVPPGQPIQVNMQPHTTVGRFRIPHMHHHHPNNGGQSTNQGQQTPASMDASTATRTNAATNTNQAAPATSTSSLGTNTTNQAGADPAQANSSSSIGTGTDPGLGTNSRSTNTPRTPIFIQQGRGQGGVGRRLVFPGPRPGGEPRAAAAPPAPGEPPVRPAAPLGRAFVDVYLPCPSHHYHSRSARQIARTARNHGPQQQVPNLSTMVSGMVGDIIGQVGQARQGQPNGGNQQATGTAATSTSSANAANGTASAPRQAAFNPMQMLASMMGGGGIITPPGGGGGGGGMPAAGQGPAQQMPFDLNSIFTNLVSQLSRPSDNQGNNGANTSAPAAAATPMGGTLADLFQHFRRSTDQSSDGNDGGPIQALIETVAPHLRVMDIFSLVMGNLRVLGQLRGTLRTFVDNAVSEHGSLDALVQASMDSVTQEVSYCASLAQVRDGIDISASICSCLRVHFDRLFRAMQSSTPTDDDEYGRGLYTNTMQMIAEVIALCVHCLRDGEAGYSTLVQQYMVHLTQGLDPGLTVMLGSSLQGILGSFHYNHRVPEADIMQYVVRQSSTSVPVSGQTASTQADDKKKEETAAQVPPQATQGTAQATTASSAPPPSPAAAAAAAATARAARSAPVKPRVPDDVVMDTSVSPSSRPPRAKVPRTLEDTESDDEFVDAPKELASHRQQSPKSRPAAVTPSSLPVSSSPRQGRQPVANGETSDQWQSIIPQEWIPVISRDIERQREQRSQPPLSDAYLQGLPAKRRRMMVLEHAAEMSNMHHYLPSSIARAARAARAEPISSEQNLIQEATEETELQEALEQEMQTNLEGRLSSDNDFNADQFPKSKEYFHKSKRH